MAEQGDERVPGHESPAHAPITWETFYVRGCFILSLIGVIGGFAVIFYPTDAKLNEGAMAMISSIIAFWMGRLGR